MKITWEAQDIKPGRSYSREGIEETWLIGYLSYEDGPARYVSVSSTDGLVTSPKSAETLAAMLTQDGYVPVEWLEVRAQGHQP